MENAAETTVNEAHGAAVLLRFLRVAIHKFAVAIGYVVVTGLLLCLLHDLGLKLESKKMLTKAVVLNVSEAEPEEMGEEKVGQDFDGDGVVDEYRSDWHRVEPVFGKRTLGLVEVVSGRTGEVLVAYPSCVPGLGGGWCEDYDGNGTIDIFLRGESGWVVLGFVGDHE